METPSRHSFALDGSTRVFPIPSPIKGDNYCRLEVDGVVVSDRALYDIVNNSIVFLDAATVPSGSQLDVLVVQSEEAIGQLSITFNIDIVASNIAAVNIVATDIDNVNTVATDIASVLTTATSITNVNTVATDIAKVIIAADNIADINTIVANLAEILQADDNAATATLKASEALASANAAAASALEAATTLASTVKKDSDTGAASLPTGTIAQRPLVPTEGMFRRNSETGAFEGYDGSSWTGVGGASGGAGNPVFYENDQIVSQDYTITAGKNAMSAGDILIADGVTVTVPDNSTWSIV